MKNYSLRVAILAVLSIFLSCVCKAQVNSGSNGSDGALNVTGSTNFTINMADHPNGIYQYSSVHIDNGVFFIPNANNTPVIWLVQSNVVISGTANLSVAGQSASGTFSGAGGPGGGTGGSGGSNPSGGYGPGGGGVSGGGSFGTQGGSLGGGYLPGVLYGNSFLFPLLGGSGGGGASGSSGGGGGGGGAIMIVASGTIQLNGIISAYGGSPVQPNAGGGGSGGAIRLVATQIIGNGKLDASGGGAGSNLIPGGSGRLRIDSFQNSFGGQTFGAFAQGSQFVIIPTAGQGSQLTVTSIGGVSVSATPTGVLYAPDAILSAQQDNPIPVVVHCSNVPLNTQITVSVKPATSAAISVIGLNSTGTLASSTATVYMNIPRGGGLIYATATTGN